MTINLSKISLYLTGLMLVLGLSTACASVSWASQPLLLKTADQPQIYFISQRTNMKKLIPNEQVFYSYGNRWAWVKTVSRSELDSYRNVRLVRKAGDSAIYYLAGTTKHLVPNEQIFAERGFSNFEVLEINQMEFDTYHTGSPLTSSRDYVTSSIPENRKVVSTVAIRQVEIRNRNDQTTMVAGTSATALRLSLKPSNSREVYISRVTLSVYGLDHEATGIRSVYLTDGAGRRLTSSVIPSGGRVVFDLASNPFTIAARGETIINAIVETANGGGYVGLRLDSGGFVATTATNVTGVFPIRGPLSYVEPAGTAGGRVIATLYNEKSDTVAVSGMRRQLLAKIVMHEQTGDSDLRLTQLRLTQTGSATAANMSNFQLVDLGTGRAIASSGRLSNGIVQFTTNSSNAVIPAAGTRTIGVYADIRQGFYETISLQLASGSDIVILNDSRTTAVRVPVTVNNHFTTSDPTTTIVEGNVTAYISSQGRSARVNSGAAEIPLINLGTITLRTKDVPAVIYGFNLELDTFGNDRALHSIVIKDRNANSLASASARPMIDGPSTVTFSEPIRLDARQTYTFTIYGEARSSVATDDAVRLKLTDFHIRNADGTSEGAGWHIEGIRQTLISQR